MAKAYQAMLEMPLLWLPLIDVLEKLQPPSTRDLIYKKVGEADNRERSWFTCKRTSGIVGFTIPTSYGRNKNRYPRVKPLGRGNSKLGLLGVHKAFRTAVLGDFNQKLKPLGWCLFEVDIVSCHLYILASIKLKTPLLQKTLAERGNVWKSIHSNLSEKMRDKFSFPFLKACIKRLAYKCLQGGRIDSVEKIYNTLEGEQKLVGKDLQELSKELAKQALLLEFDWFNRQVMEKFRRLKRVEVFIPTDEAGFVLVENKKVLQGEGRTSNPCRIASQVVTGVETLEILILLEGMRKLQLPWVPLSLHHDGFAILAREDGLETSKQRLELYATE